MHRKYSHNKGSFSSRWKYREKNWRKNKRENTVYKLVKLLGNVRLAARHLKDDMTFLYTLYSLTVNFLPAEIILTVLFARLIPCSHCILTSISYYQTMSWVESNLNWCNKSDKISKYAFSQLFLIHHPFYPTHTATSQYSQLLAGVDPSLLEEV